MGPVRRTAPILADDLRFLLAESDRPVKVTLPGPMIVVDSTLDEHCGDEEAMAIAMTAALDEEARELGRMGTAVIQFDEPVFSRYPDKVRAWGIAALDRAAAGIRHAASAVHVCYSYPMSGVPRPIVVSYPVILAERLRPAAAHLPAEKIQAAPDCGLVPLSPPLARAKRRALAAGDALARERLRG